MADRKRTVTIRFPKPDVVPPVYLAGSFSDPAWQPQEMQYTVDEEHGTTEYHKEVEVIEGKEYQYKFRIGDGDWWLLNEDSPTVTDDVGNRNNLLAVPVNTEPIKQEEPQQASSIPETSSPSAETIEKMDSEAEHKDTGETNGTEGEEESSDLDKDDIKGEEKSPDLEKNDIKGEENDPVLEKPEEVAELSTEKMDSEAEHKGTGETNGIEGEEKSPDLEKMDFKGEEKNNSVLAKPGELAEPSTADVPLPIVVVEKTDSAPQYGDDFGPDATVAQRDAHSRRASDAKPDLVIIRDQTSTPDFVNVAAEVADSAAILDRSESNTPAISNEEAGEIGYRRMSMTPIQDVADTAAEVADSAAIIDKGTLKIDDLPSYAIEDHEERAGSNPVTPWEERVPLFEHECLKRPEGGETEQPSPQPDYDHIPKRSYELPEEIDLNDPSIEDFPCEREAILKQLRTTATRLNEDETRFDGEPYSPVVGSVRRGENGELPSPSPRLLSKEGQSPSLKSNSEDDAYEGVLAKLPSAYHSLERPSQESIGNGRREPLPTHEEEAEEDAQENNLPTPPPEIGEPITKEIPESSTIPPPESVESAPEEVAESSTASPPPESGEPITKEVLGSSTAPPPESVESGPEEVAESPTIPPPESVESVPEEVAAPSEATPASELQDSVKSIPDDVAAPSEVVPASEAQDSVRSFSEEVAGPSEAAPTSEAQDSARSIPDDVAAPSTIAPALEVQDLSSETPAENETISVDEQTMDGAKMTPTLSPDPIKLPLTPFILDNSKQLGESTDTNEIVAPENGPVVQVLPATPAVQGNSKQLDKPEDEQTRTSEEPREVVTPEEGPVVTVQPATPGSSLKARTSDVRASDFVQKPDTAKTTAIEEENGHSQLTKRKTSPTPERPLTPQSMRSTQKEPKSRNFLKSFLRLIFVDWIGGLIMRLCGGNRRA